MGFRGFFACALLRAAALAVGFLLLASVLLEHPVYPSNLDPMLVPYRPTAIRIIDAVGESVVRVGCAAASLRFLCACAGPHRFANAPAEKHKKQ